MTQLQTNDPASSERWPGIATAPHKPLRAAVARWLLRRIAPQTPVEIQLPDGSILGQRHAGAPRLVIVREDFFQRLGADLKIGLGEAYMAGDWHAADGSDLADVLTPFAERLLEIVPAWMRKFRTWIEPVQPHHERNHREGARSNISRHYDLSNELFSLFLDETLTYSSAWFKDSPRDWNGLADAQRSKVQGILDFAGVKSGERLLEIGTGWGQLAIQAASRGATVHSITLSAEQKSLAELRIAAAGFADLVTVELRDYRDLGGEYDAIASVEMIEAVGEEYWNVYFGTVRNHLRPGGRFGLQAITMPHDRMLASKHAYTWIHKYIFPGGLIPSVEAIEHEVKSHGMRIVDARAFGKDYATTLRIWRQRFLENRAQVDALGFDDTFKRMWEFYLAYSEAGFASGHLDVWQFSIERP